MPSAPRAPPSNITVAPPSGKPGTPPAVPFAENENTRCVAPPPLWVEKAQSMAVASNALPLTFPVPEIER